MIVIDLQYNDFSEVNHFNNNFVPGVKKLKITLEAISSTKVYKEASSILSKQFAHIFPNLKLHHCCNKKYSGIFKIKSKNRKLNAYVLNVIHYIEHIIIDLQCAISKMKICSGITCNYYEPSNRYDIFVECIDQKVGFFAAQLAIDMVQQILNNNRFIETRPTPANPQLIDLHSSLSVVDQSTKNDYYSYLAKSFFLQIKN